MAEIRLEGLGKRFGEVSVASSLDLTISDGEFFTFVGPSGCGKSTILNMIAGLEPATAGTIYFDGVAVNDLSPAERDVAMVFQSYALYPHMTAYENIAFPLRMRKVRKDVVSSEVKRVSALLGLKDMLHRKPGELSGGQRQRVALGRAIIRRPRLFLMDEPLSNLDARLRLGTKAELKRLHQELKITTIYVTHDQAEALSLSDRIAVLDRGLMQQCGTPRDIYSKPSNLFVAGFIGSTPMNFFPASVAGERPLEIEVNGVVFSPAAERPPGGHDVVVGIRPEDITVSMEKPAAGIEVEVVLTEPAGPINWIDCLWNGLQMKGAAPPDLEMKPGGRAFMKFSRDRITVFDGITGKRL